jgi:hypothetical protein
MANNRRGCRSSSLKNGWFSESLSTPLRTGCGITLNNKENVMVSLVIDQNDSYEMTRSKLYKALVDSNFDKFLASEMLGLKIYETQRLMSEYQIKRPYTLA